MHLSEKDKITEDNFINVYIKIFAHYPEIYNATIISDKFNVYFEEYFKVNKPLSSEYKGDCDVVIKSAPHTEVEMIKIEVIFTTNVDETIDKEKVVSEWKTFMLNFFDNHISDVIIKFMIC